MNTPKKSLLLCALICVTFFGSTAFADNPQPIELQGLTVLLDKAVYDSNHVRNKASIGWTGLKNLPDFKIKSNRISRVVAGTKNVSWRWVAKDKLSEGQGFCFEIDFQLGTVPASIQSGMGGLFNFSLNTGPDSPSINFTLQAAHVNGGSWLLNGLSSGIKLPGQSARKPFDKTIIAQGAAILRKGPALDTAPHQIRVIVLSETIAVFWDKELIYQVVDSTIKPAEITVRLMDPGAEFKYYDLITMQVSPVSKK